MMQTVNVNVTARMTTEDLIQAARQLNARELQRLAAAVLAEQAERVGSTASKHEVDLLARANICFPPDLQARFDILVARRQAETLTHAEQRALIRLADQAEALDVQRLEALVELAALRKMPLDALMAELGLGSPEYA